MTTLLASASIAKIAQQVSGALIKISIREETARLSLPLLYPGGSMVPVEISKLRDSFLVSDAGVGRREASLLGGERTFLRIASDIATRFGVRFDHNMFFDAEVPADEVVVAVIAVANASKTAVENTAMQMAVTTHADFRASVWEKLDRVFGSEKVQKSKSVRGSSEEWEFDAVVKLREHISLFEVVIPHANAVNSAVTKFLDVRDLGKAAPGRIAVLTDKDRTPHLPVLARTAKWISYNASDANYRKAA
jgi:hypothetical protein